MKSHIRLLALFLLLVILTGCGKTEPAATEILEEMNEVTVTESPEPAEVPEAHEEAESIEAAEEAEIAETAAPEIDVNEALSDVWNIMDNECVEEIPILPGLLIDDIEDWMKETEFKEIKLYQRTDWNQVRLGLVGDTAVAQIAMVGDNITEVEDFVWNVRMEKSDKLENKTAIVIPDDAETSEWMNNSPEVPVKWYIWPNDDGTWTEMYIVYFEETQNLYTFYSNQLVYEFAGETLTYSNSNRWPIVVISYIKADGNDYYDNVFEQDVQAAKNVVDIRYFRIETFDGVLTYQYRFGTKLNEWVYSEYNTDGWKISSEDSNYVVSADNKFRLKANQYIWRTMPASLNGIDYAK